MHYRLLGRSDLRVSAISLGTWLSAGDILSAQDFANVVAAAFDAGITTFDTADSYAFGDAERALGQVLRNYARDRFVVLSKCFFSTDPQHPEPPGLSKKAVLAAAEASLQRLKLDVIDVLQCHRFDPKTPIAETVEAMEQLVQEGKIRFWGVSKWPNEAINEALKCGGKHLVCRQELYNLFHREPETEHFDFCREHELSLLAYSPLARGVLTGKYAHGVPDNSRAADEKHKQTVYDLTPEKLQQAALLDAVAAEKGCTSGQLALAFLLWQDPVATAIIGARSSEQVISNAKATEIKLSLEDVERIDRIFFKQDVQPESKKYHVRAN